MKSIAAGLLRVQPFPTLELRAAKVRTLGSCELERMCQARDATLKSLGILNLSLVMRMVH